ncbi:MAG: hypothetical protein OMM_00833 [Candidatus Magnetoglobus multicellularis str. Araruama]|uniref:Uncharacterized protein n=1 Tax=Candidatus Magnetoglobus multicellularis str. Araruama TaxID=890399 RepID=A0A1V1PFM3_9BACT|nr:MAG: hypothetical protein OMM_00833 [Candidatus Magnetoglobus multicellularis str. Araruama]
MEKRVNDTPDFSEHVLFKSFQYFVGDLKTYLGFFAATLFTHSVLLYLGSYLWVNYTGIYESQHFINAYIHTSFEIGYLFSHNLWWLSLKVHIIVCLVCLINAIICKFFLIYNLFYDVIGFVGKLIIWYIPNILIGAFLIEDAYIFDYKTTVMISVLPGLMMSHPSVILVRTIIPDLGDIHRVIIWCFGQRKTVPAQM